MFDYFLGDRVDRDVVRAANNSVIDRVDEVWVFGVEISNGVYLEILRARGLKKTVRFFSIGSTLEEIVEVTVKDLTFEQELLNIYHGDNGCLLTSIV